MRRERRAPASFAARGFPASRGDATPGSRRRKKTSASLERVLEVLHQELVDASGDLLEEFLAVGQLVLAAGLVPAAARAPRGVDARRGAHPFALWSKAETRLGTAQVQRLHRRAVALAVLRLERPAPRPAHVQGLPDLLPHQR